MSTPLSLTRHPMRLALTLALLLAPWAAATHAELVLNTPARTFGLGSLRCAIYTPSGLGIYAAGSLGDITLFNAQTGKVLRTFKGHTSAVNCLALTPDGKRLLSGGSDSTARLWDTASGALLITCKAPHSGADPILSVALSPDAQTIATGSQYGGIQLWKSVSQSRLLLGSPASERSSLYPVAFSHDGKTLAASRGDRYVKLWDVASGAVRRTFVDHTAEVASVAFSPDDKLVISGGVDRTVISWDAATGEVVGYYTGHGNIVNFVAYSPDGRSVLTASNDCTIRIWNAATCQVTRTLALLKSAPAGAGFSADGAKVLAACPGKYQIYQWNAANGDTLTTLSRYGGPIKAAALSPDSRLLLTGHAENVARVWDLASGELKFAVSTALINAVAFTPDGSQFITACTSHASQWSAVTGAELGEFKFIEFAPVMAISRDGKRILIKHQHYDATQNYSYGCFDFLARQLLASYTGQCSALCFMPSNYDFVVGRDSGSVQLLSGDTGAAIRSFTGHMGAIYSLQVFANGERLLTGSADGSARIWNMANGYPVRTFPVSSPVYAAAASPSGLHVLTGAKDLRLWDASSGSLLARFSSGSTMAVGFTRDGRLLSAGSDGRARLWSNPSNGVASSAWSRYE